MKGSDWVSLGIGAIIVYVLYQWMQGASVASSTLTNTLTPAASSTSTPVTVNGSTIVPLPTSGPGANSTSCAAVGAIYNPQAGVCTAA